MKLSIGVESTLGNYRDIAAMVWGADSRAVAFMDEKIRDAPTGRDEPVLADESQMVYLLTVIHSGHGPQ
jgi:hypothetical protein